jgi:thymidylate synthase
MTQPGKFLNSMTTEWLSLLVKLLVNGDPVSPRGRLTRELPGYQMRVDMSQPVLRCEGRALSYQFMAADALWILSGDNRVAPLARFAATISRFSDDGETFAGAYGPRVVAQLGYCIETLLDDRSSRQSVMTMWRPVPGVSKDIPCTIGLMFTIRGMLLHCHSFMRSNDAWLGTPYDVFSFSMIATKVACEYNRRRAPSQPAVYPGTLYHTAASMHIYDTNIDRANQVIGGSWESPDFGAVPYEHVRDGNWQAIEDDIIACREQTPPALWRIQP